MAPDSQDWKTRVEQLQKLGILCSERLKDTDRAIGAWRLILEIEPANQRARSALKGLGITQDT